MSESWGNDAGVPGFRLGAIHRPAPASTPVLRASMPMLDIPSECRWDKTLDLTGDDGQPDALGNDEVGNCVPCGALRLMQLWAGDGRKPTRAQAMELLRAWDGDPVAGTATDEAWKRFAERGYPWGDQRKIVPRWTVLEADGVAVNLNQLRTAIFALGGVLATVRLPRSALNYTEWKQPKAGTPDAEDVGHHLVLYAGYDPSAFYTVSWGRSIPTGQAFVSSRTVQASAFVSDAWVRPDGQGGSVTPSGLSADQIRAIGAQVEGV